MKKPSKSRQTKAPVRKTSHKKADKKKHRGFTIIEVLIVLAIAGMILAAIMLIVPTVNRNARNDGRKRTVNLTATQLDSYRNDHNGQYPRTAAQMCDFMTGYLKEQLGSGSICNPTFSATGDCVRVVGERSFNFCFHNEATSSHSYIGPHDEISIQLGHWCNTDPAASGEPAANPITSGSGGHPPGVYTVWAQLEPSLVYCVDNYSG